MNEQPKLRVGDRVFDSWWPIRLGVVTFIGKSRTRVSWVDGETWSYDRSHQQFIRRTR